MLLLLLFLCKIRQARWLWLWLWTTLNARGADVEMRCDGNGTRMETEPCRRSEMPAELVFAATATAAAAPTFAKSMRAELDSKKHITASGTYHRHAGKTFALVFRYDCVLLVFRRSYFPDVKLLSKPRDMWLDFGFGYWCPTVMGHFRSYRCNVLVRT